MNDFNCSWCTNLLYHRADRAESHDLKSRLWLFFSLFLFLLNKRGKKKREWIVKIVILSHAFLLDPQSFTLFSIISFSLCFIFLMLLSLSKDSERLLFFLSIYLGKQNFDFWYFVRKWVFKKVLLWDYTFSKN